MQCFCVYVVSEAVSEIVDIKIFLGEHAPTPPSLGILTHPTCQTILYPIPPLLFFSVSTPTFQSWDFQWPQLDTHQKYFIVKGHYLISTELKKMFHSILEEPRGAVLKGVKN